MTVAKGLLCWAVAVLLIACGANDQRSLWRSASPSLDLGPEEVVAIQVEALRNNDREDRGIRVAFRFASPENRRSTGPIERFAHGIKNGPYRVMLGAQGVSYGLPEVSGRRAFQRVTLFGKSASATYVFVLSQQDAGDCIDCWMTDAVLVEPTREYSI